MVSAGSCGRRARAPSAAAAGGVVLVPALLSAAAGGALPMASPEDVGVASERLARGGTGVSVWIEPAEDMITIFMIQGGSGGALRGAFENAVRQAIID